MCISCRKKLILSLYLVAFADWFLPVDWLHLSGDAHNGSWGKPVKLLEKVPDVNPVFQVQVKLHDAPQTWERKEEPSVWRGRLTWTYISDYKERFAIGKSRRPFPLPFLWTDLHGNGHWFRLTLSLAATCPPCQSVTDVRGIHCQKNQERALWH